MEQVYIDTLSRMKNEGIAGIVFNGKFQFDIKYQEGTLYFSKVIDYITKEVLVPDMHSVSCPYELVEKNLDILVESFMKKYVYYNADL